MRKPVAPVLAMALVIGTSVLAGCTITVRGRAGATTEPAASPPPPPPPRPQQPPPPPPPPPPQNNPPMVGSVQVRPHRNIRVVNNKVQLPGPIVFDPGTANLRPESDAVLEVVLDYMNQEKQVNLLRIEGHTDSDGYPATNMDLSKERAMAVAKWLVAHGVDCKRLLPVGFGQTMPIADNNTIEGKAQNRRVDFVVASEKGKPITDSNGKPLPVDGGGQGQVAGDPCH